MALTVGSRLGAYEVLSPLGSGGMGEVYRARDTKLGRAVAIKVLPEAFAFDPDRVARFEREAKVLASLNHPHIAALHGLEVSDGRHFLIMELVEGETLADRLRRGPMAVEDALKVAIQIADALEAAHEKGVIHRDLKPANVKVTPDDKVKVLDFGLAKAMEPVEAGPANPTHSPTLSMMATQAGMILGTAAYMSPEQAKGLPADQRSDMFSFGCVLYEMLTGRQPFQGETTPDILASVLAREPELSALPPNLNPRLLELLRRCLDKHPKRRWQAVGDLRAELESIAASPRSAPTPAAVVVPPRPLRRRAIPVVLSAIVASVLASAATMYLTPAPPPLVVTRFPWLLAEGQTITAETIDQVVAISPDGTLMAYTAGALYIRSMSEPEARRIAEAVRGRRLSNPVFAPDSRSVAFYSNDGTLKRVAVSGGAPVTIARVNQPLGMSWGTDGILFGDSNGISRLSANGGVPEVLVSAGEDEQLYGPQMLSGGDAVLFTLARGTAGGDRSDRAQIVAQSRRSGERKTLVDGGSAGRYVPTGHLVYANGGVVFAVPMDLRRLEVTGAPVPVIEGVRRSFGNATGAAQFSFSDTGSLVYLPGPLEIGAGESGLAVIDRKGAAEPLKLPPAPYQHPRVSPNGKQIAIATDDGKQADVWIYDLGRTTSMRRLTFGGRNRFPMWSADGERIAFQSDREGDFGIFWQRADGSGAAERLTKPDSDTSHVPESWSPVGDRFLFAATKGSNVSLWAFSLQDRKAMPFGDVQAPNRTNAAFSPDGRWVAYNMPEGRGIGVYVQPFPATGAKYLVSKANTVQPVWSRDGRELLSQPQGGFWAVQTVTTQPSFAFSAPVMMSRAGAVGLGPILQRNYDVMPDGRMLGVIPAAPTQSTGSTGQRIEVVLNWLEELKQRVPVK